jgi:hypothetical protein
MFGLEYCGVSQVQPIRVANPAESRFYEVRVHARFIKQNDRPYSNGMGREAHVLVSHEIRMAGLSNRLEYFCDLVGSEIPHYALMVDEDAHCAQVDSMCCAHRTNVTILVVGS